METEYKSTTLLSKLEAKQAEANLCITVFIVLISVIVCLK
jgi:hypothetical protein